MGTKNTPGKFDCYVNAAPDEPMFILLGRDPVASFVVEFWINLRRIREGGSPDEVQLEEALSCARSMRDFAIEKGKLSQIEAVALNIERMAALP
jgi:hypothetical protein